MKPFFFGPSSRALYGVLHAPAGPPRPEGIVLAHPSAHLYMRWRWIHRRIGEGLAAAGFPVLRFDWSGTGDSAGDLAEVTLATWMDDAALAVAELRDAGVQRICLSGVGLSATLIAEATAGGLSVDDLLLVDPVLDGRQHLSWLETVSSSDGEEDVDQMLALPLSPSLKAEIEALAPMVRLPRCKGKLLILDTTDRGGRLTRAIEESGQTVIHRFALEAADTHPSDLEEAMLSTTLADEVVRLLVEQIR